MPETTRLECYGRIRDSMKNRIIEYYRMNPTRMGDDRGQAAIKESMDGLKVIFNILDEYEIRRKPNT